MTKNDPSVPKKPLSVHSDVVYQPVYKMSSVSKCTKKYQNSLGMMPTVLDTDPILSVPNATGVPNVPTVPNVPKISMNDPTVPKTTWCTNWCTKRQVYQSAPNVPKLARNDAPCAAFAKCTKGSRLTCMLTTHRCMCSIVRTP